MKEDTEKKEDTERHLDKHAKCWWRGNLHLHTFWSDGRAFPEEAIIWYKARGYNFLGLSDHNLFQDDDDHWISESGRERYFSEYLKAFPDAELREETQVSGLKSESVCREARLSTFFELAQRFDEPGRFMLIPDYEATRSIEYDSGRHHEVHMNIVNLPQLIPAIAASDFVRTKHNLRISDFIALHEKETSKLAHSLGRRAVFMLNHPQWQWYDIPPEALIEASSVRFFEVCNNGTELPSCPELPQDGFDTDRFWDVVNAFRVRRGLPLLYGLGGDDTHVYRNEPHGGMLMPFNAWILVRSPSLDAASLLEAMHEGDFVACEGIEPQDIAFDRGSGTLSVSVAAKPGVARTVKFIVSKADFSETPIRTITVRPPSEQDRPFHERTIRTYDEKIGLVAKTVVSGAGEALTASYTLAPDDLYVRARIEEPGQTLCTANLHPHCLACWTQPYSVRM